MLGLPEQDQLHVYIVPKDTPFLEYQHPFPLIEGPDIHPLQEYVKYALNVNRLGDTDKGFFQLPCQDPGIYIFHS